MSYEMIGWKDHVVERPRTYRMVTNSDGTVTLTPAFGEVIQQGTAQSATNFGKMDEGILESIATAGQLAVEVRHLKDKTEGLEGERIEVTLTNTQRYPFNNSKKTINLSRNRNTKDYTVSVEVVDKTGGGVGDIVISDKLLNGFKIAHTGAAKSVDVICTIQGGI